MCAQFKHHVETIEILGLLAFLLTYVLAYVKMMICEIIKKKKRRREKKNTEKEWKAIIHTHAHNIRLYTAHGKQYTL